MRLVELLVDLPDVVAVTGDSQIVITAVTADSRQVIPGACFVAYRGLGVDGHRFIPDALARGAAAIVGEQALAALPAESAAYVQVADGRAALAWLSAAWYGNPSRSMALVGITGTDGKTTTANLLFNILQAASRRVGLISTVHAVIGDQVYNTGLHTTTPDAPDVQRFLAQMRDAGTEIAVLETTSHGLAQHRVTGCAFDVAVVTNITHEHLDFHGSYEAYRDAKALLFRSLSLASGASANITPALLLDMGAGPIEAPRSALRMPALRQAQDASPGSWRGAKSFDWLAQDASLPCLPKTAVLNRDDSSFAYLAQIPAERVITYGAEEPRSGGVEGQESRGAGESISSTTLHLTAVNICHTPSGTEFDIHFTPCPRVPVSPCHIITPLIGVFNVSNILAAAGAALALGIGPAAIAAGVRATAGIPGRMERIDVGQPFTAIVDFAHTPNALARALEAVRPLARPGGRVIAVFGSAGLRDREKRHLMGEVAARLADVTVVTAEDPRTEDLAAIMAETAAALAAAGRAEGADFFCVADRQRAILHAVRLADPGDVVIVCGKGHEQSMCFGVTEHPWRDQDALRWALAARDRVTHLPPFELPTWNRV